MMKHSVLSFPVRTMISDGVIIFLTVDSGVVTICTNFDFPL